MAKMEKSTFFSKTRYKLNNIISGTPEPEVRWYKDWNPLTLHPPYIAVDNAGTLRIKGKSLTNRRIANPDIIIKKNVLAMNLTVAFRARFA